MSQSKPKAKSNSKKESSTNWKKTVLKYALFAVATVTAGCVALYLSISWRIIGNVPDKNDLLSIRNYTATEIYSADSVLLGKYFLQDRTNVSYSQISKYMIEALIATEDARFYEHSGVDKIGMLRVLVKSILMGNESAGGGSTLSQQVVKNIFPREKYWLLSMPINKIKEAITAQKLESLFSKNDILELYLNTVSFGENAYGVQSAAKRYFNTTAQKLTLEQAATLVGILKATNSYNPKKHPEKSLQRRNIVIGQMLKYNYIDAKTAELAKQKPIKLDFRPVSISDGLAPYFREYLRQELVKWCSENTKPDGSNYNLYTDGLKIYTTIDSRMQRYAEQSVAEHMALLQQQFNAHWGKQNPWGNQSQSATYR
jgi:penicillin-binding protein 1A